jgi:hypothetical protein
VKLTWVIEGQGAGEATSDSVDDVAAELTHAVRQAYDDLDTQTLAHIMINKVAPLRMELVTTGRFEVEHGRTWELRREGISVTLSPN